MNKNTKLSSRTSSNYLNDPEISDFFKADDYLNYYYTLSADEKRNFSLEIISHNMPFLFLLNEQEIGNKINEIIKNGKIGKIDINEKINDTAKRINPDGYNLLSINNKLTKEYLTECYRIACKIHHPDVGGSNEKMQIINTAIGQFRNILKTYSLHENAIEDDYRKINSLNDFKYALAEQLFSICVDMFLLTNSIEIYSYLKKHLLTFKKYSKYFTEWSIDDLDKLAVRLYKSGDTINAEFFLGELKLFCSSQIESGLSNFYYDNIYNKCKRKLYGESPARIVIRHIIQAENALKLKIIDEKRFEKLKEKYCEKNQKEKSVELRLNEYIEKHAFISNLGIYDLLTGSTSTNYVPGLELFYDRYELLSRDQKIEYGNMFSKPVRLPIIKKYLKIRKISYLLSLIQNYDEFRSIEVIRECKFLSEIFNDESFLQIIEAFNYLKNIDPTIRKRKLRLLNEMDYSTDPDHIGIKSNIFESDFEPIKGKKRIYVSQDYIDFMKCSIEQLIDFKNLNKDPLINSDHLNDLEKIEKINRNELLQNSKEKGNLTNSHPNDIIKASLPIIAAQLELIPTLQIRSTKRLWIGSRINNLTINYAKIKDWNNVKKWIEIFFNLPENHQKETSTSEINALKKRLSRANNKLSIIK